MTLCWLSLVQHLKKKILAIVRIIPLHFVCMFNTNLLKPITGRIDEAANTCIKQCFIIAKKRNLNYFSKLQPKIQQASNNYCNLFCAPRSSPGERRLE